MWHLIVDQALPTTRFYHISGVGEIRGHSTLLSALVEMWRLKTHSFVLPTGKVTVTLEDVLHILGLLIDGEIVTGGVIIHESERKCRGARRILGMA
ncbi:hypothetical protein AHAS_Ahas17G0303800 [Arachis hypogaea]